MDKKILPFEMGYLPEFYQKKAEVELGETSEKIRKGLCDLRSMINSDRTFNGMTIDDGFLLQYLRCRKFKTKKAFSHLKTAAEFRRKNLKYFRDYDFEKISFTTKKKVLTYLPYRCPDGCAIVSLQLRNWIPEEFPIEDFRRMVTIMLLQGLRDPMTQVNGIKVIVDASIPIPLLRYMTPYNIYLLYYGTQVSAPGRFKGIHVINNSVPFKCGWAIFQHFMSAKVKERIHFHDNIETLLNHFPAEVLPEEYGGKLGDYDMTDWLRGVMSPEKIATLGGGECPGM